MKSIGKVISILNSTNLVVSIPNARVEIDSNVYVIGSVSLPNSETIAGFEMVFYPKGKIKLVAPQGNGIYLASVVTSKPARKTVFRESPFAQLAGLSALFTGAPEEVVDFSETEPTAVLDSNSSLNLKMDKVVRIGDSISSEIE